MKRSSRRLRLPGLAVPVTLASLATLVSLAACSSTSASDGAPDLADAEPGVRDEDASFTPAEAGTRDAADAGEPDPCDVAVVPPPATLELDAFYTKYLDAEGIPVVGSGKPSDAAIRQACRIVRRMVSAREDVRQAMITNKARVAVMARTEKTTDIPEHSDLYTAFPGVDWDTRARGLGGTLQRPATSCAEENLLCDATDPYLGENILVHELAHGIHLLGVNTAIPTFQARLSEAYDQAMAAQKWKDTYAATNVDEYFAEGVQSYFETNIEASPPNGIHNEVNTRAELLAYDPALHALVEEIFGAAVWTPTCP